MSKNDGVEAAMSRLGMQRLSALEAASKAQGEEIAKLKKEKNLQDEEIAKLKENVAKLEEQKENAEARIKNHTEWNHYLYYTLKAVRAASERQSGQVDAILKMSNPWAPTFNHMPQRFQELEGGLNTRSTSSGGRSIEASPTESAGHSRSRSPAGIGYMNPPTVFM